jgi:hypothetical protein
LRATLSAAVLFVVLFRNAGLLSSIALLPMADSSSRPLAALAFAVLAVTFVPFGSRLARAVRLGALISAVLAMGWALLPPTIPQVAAVPETDAKSTRDQPTERLLVLGLDGADWNFLEQLFARGLAPHLARFRSEGAWGELATIQPTRSPAIWTTMVTGRSPEEHGVLRHTVERPRGLDVGSPATGNRVRSLGLSFLGNWLKRSGRLVEGPVTGAERRVPAFWNITTHFGIPVSVVSWWATWPELPWPRAAWVMPVPAPTSRWRPRR